MNIWTLAISVGLAGGLATQAQVQAQPATLAVLETKANGSTPGNRIMSLTNGKELTCEEDVTCIVPVVVKRVDPGMCWANIEVGIVKTKKARLTIKWQIQKEDELGDSNAYQFADDGIYFLKDINDDIDPLMHFRKRVRVSTPTMSVWRGTDMASLPIHYTPLVFYNAGTVANPLPIFCGASDPKIVNLP